jgi:indolepyruvate ferredoxin oxidoreductase
VQLEFYMAPPVLSRAKGGQAPRKVRLGGWMLPAMKLLAQGRRLRGTASRRLRPHGGAPHGARAGRGYRERIEALLPALSAERLKAACDIAACRCPCAASAT